MLAVENRRKAGCGLITLFWSSSVRRPETSSTRWITNITSGRPASYSSNTSAMLCCSAQGRMPSRNSVTCLPSLMTIEVLADQIDTADVAVEIDAHAGPVEPCGDLLDVGRFAGAVIAGDHDAAVPGKAGEDRERGGAIEAIIRIDLRHMRVDLRHRPALRGRYRCRTPAGPTPSCRADRRAPVVWSSRRSSFILRGPGIPETRFLVWLRIGLLDQAYQRATAGRSPRFNQSSVVLS